MKINKFTWFGITKFVGSRFVGNAKGNTARDSLNNLKSCHEEAITDINDLLATSAPEVAEDKFNAEIAETHPHGVHKNCQCTHTARITTEGLDTL